MQKCISVAGEDSDWRNFMGIGKPHAFSTTCDGSLVTNHFLPFNYKQGGNCGQQRECMEHITVSNRKEMLQNQDFLSLFYFSFSLFYILFERQRRSFTHWFITPQMLLKARTGPTQSQNPRTQPRSPVGVAGSHLLQLLFSASGVMH